MRKGDPYTEAQWRWLAYQYKRGHGYKEIAAFVDLPYYRIKAKLVPLGAIPENRYKWAKFAKPMLPPLETEKKEFNRLGGNEDECSGKHDGRGI